MKLAREPNKNIPLVFKLAKQIHTDSDILANIAACQAILESRLLANPSKLAFVYCNLFGQKAGKTIPQGTAGVVQLETGEVIKGKKVLEAAKFLSNLNIEDSFFQHKKLLELPRYKRVRDAQSFNEAAEALVLCGYATDPDYSVKLINIYNKFGNK